MNDILTTVITTAIPIITVYTVNVLVKIANNFATKIENVKIQQYVREITTAVETAVKATNQTYVDSFKAKGNFTPANQENALNQAFITCLNQLSKETKDYICDNYNDMETYITSLIESEVANQKQ